MQATTDRLIEIIQTPYAFTFRQCEDLHGVIFGETTDEGRIELIKNLFAFWLLPIKEDIPEVKEVPSFSPLEMRKVANDLDRMQTAGKLSCRCFHSNLPAVEVAKTFYIQLQQIGSESGRIAQVVFINSMLNSKHVPYCDLAHNFGGWDMDNAPEIFAANPVLFAELSTMLTNKDVLSEEARLGTVCRWLGHIQCEPDVRAALIWYVVRAMATKKGMPVPDMIVGLLGPLPALPGPADDDDNEEESGSCTIH